MSFDKSKRRKRIHYRVRAKIAGTVDRPRMSVYRSNKEIYCQLIDDQAGVTIVTASSRDEGVDKTANKSAQASQVGKLIAEKAKARKIDTVVFDRGGFLYHGRLKALAEGAREAGLSI